MQNYKIKGFAYFSDAHIVLLIAICSTEHCYGCWRDHFDSERQVLAFRPPTLPAHKTSNGVHSVVILCYQSVALEERYILRVNADIHISGLIRN